MKLDTYDPEFSSDLDRTVRQLEFQLSEASHRSLGGLQTEDQKFAYAVWESTRDILRFLDRIDPLLEEILRNATDEINELEYSKEQLERKIADAKNFIADFQRLDQLKKIFNE